MDFDHRRALAIASVFILQATGARVVTLAERRDLRAFSLKSLRAEAAALMADSEGKDWDWCGLGYYVPPEAVPPTIKALALKAHCVAVSAEGVVLMTDCWGERRGGYLITPAGSAKARSGSRRIADGVFYVHVNSVTAGDLETRYKKEGGDPGAGLPE